MRSYQRALSAVELLPLSFIGVSIELVQLLVIKWQGFDSLTALIVVSNIAPERHRKSIDMEVNESLAPLCNVCGHNHVQGVKCHICGHVGRSQIYQKMKVECCY